MSAARDEGCLFHIRKEIEGIRPNNTGVDLDEISPLFQNAIPLVCIFDQVQPPYTNIQLLCCFHFCFSGTNYFRIVITLSFS